MQTLQKTTSNIIKQPLHKNRKTVEHSKIYETITNTTKNKKQQNMTKPLHNNNKQTFKMQHKKYYKTVKARKIKKRIEYI